MADAAAPCWNLHAERCQATVSCQLSACRSSGFGPAWLVSYSPEACKHQHQAHDCHVLGQRPPAARQQAARGAAAAAALGWLGPLLGLLWLSSSGLLGRGVVCRRTGRRARGQADHTYARISRLHRCVAMARLPTAAAVATMRSPRPRYRPAAEAAAASCSCCAASSCWATAREVAR